jgi:hypothetical protein
MKTIIAGSRNETRWSSLIRAITGSKFPITEVVSGCAKGPDQAGQEWAEINGLPVCPFPADWKRYGRAAGRQRNLQMAVYADALIAIWDGKSPGTRHMIATAERMGLKVFVYRTDLEHA